MGLPTNYAKHRECALGRNVLFLLLWQGTGAVSCELLQYETVCIFFDILYNLRIKILDAVN